MPSKLTVFNGALREIGERKLSSLTENREPRRVLDSVWDNDFIRQCLSEGLWNFAMRTVELTYSPSVSPDFGYSRAFDKPEDWVRTASMSADERFATPLLQYNDEAGYWFADLDTIYVRYVSDDDEYGSDLSLWSPKFTLFVETELAARAAKRITGSDSDAARIEKLARDRLRQARSVDAMNEPTKFAPKGSWVSARGGRGGGDRGNRGSLVG